MNPTRPGDVARALALAVIYVIAARIGLALDAVSGFATLVWAPSGLSLAALLLYGMRLWPGVFVGAVVTNYLVGAPVPVALGIGVGNALSAIAAARGLARMPEFRLSLDRTWATLALIVASALSAIVAATIGVGSLLAGGITMWANAAETWRAWWTGDLIGDLLIAPLVLAWASRPEVRSKMRTGAEALALAAATLSVGALVFFFRDADVPASAVQAYLVFPVVMWAAFRFGPLGTATATFAVAVTAIVGTVLQRGPFAGPELRVSLFALQAFMTVVAATFLVLSAAIAERGEAERQAQLARAQAEAANRTKAEFLAVMSHELRTPLNAIGGFVELFAMGALGQVTDKQRDALARIHRNEAHLLSLINDLLSFARIEAGKLAIDAVPVRVSDAFDQVEPLIQSELRRKKLVFDRHSVASGLQVIADPDKLTQILLNLLTNAAKYTGDGGHVAMGAEAEGARVRVWVRDAGIGIPEDQVEYVFEPFFQVERGRTRRFEGVGLGLTIARDLAQAMGGELKLESRIGEGTLVSVLLPLA